MSFFAAYNGVNIEIEELELGPKIKVSKFKMDEHNQFMNCNR